MATKTFKVSLSLDNPRIIQTGIKVHSFDKQSIKIAIELTKNSQVYQIPTGAQIKISLLKLARQEQKIILDVPFTSADSIDWIVPDYLDGYQGEVRVGIYLIVGTENIDVGYFNITSSVSDIDNAAEEFTESVLQGWAIDDLTALLPKFQAVLDETTGKDVISAPEIILARDGATTLGERLEEDKAEVTAQLAHKAEKSELDETNNVISATNLRIDNLVIPLSPENANIEVTDAHVSEVKNKTFPTIKTRFEDIEKNNYFPARNYVSNSELTGTTNWLITGGSGLSENGNMTLTSNGTSVDLRCLQYLSYTPKIGDKVYIKFTCTILTEGFSKIYLAFRDWVAGGTYFNQIKLDKSKIGVPQEVSTIIDIPVNFAGEVRFYLNAVMAEVIADKQISFTKPMVVNLTEVFGLGKEPNIIKFQEMLKTYTNGFFSGINNLFTAKYYVENDINLNKLVNTINDNFTPNVILSNKIINGNFSTIDKWASVYGTSTVGNNILTNTANGANVSSYVEQAFRPIIGHVYYFKASARVTNSQCNVLQIRMTANLFEPINVSNPVANEWYTGSAVKEITKVDSVVRLTQWYASTEVALGKVMELKDVLLIDLTEVFGSGNEPTKTEMDNLMAYFDGEWFDGTVKLLDGLKILEMIKQVTNSNIEKINQVESRLTELLKDSSAIKSINSFGNKLELNSYTVPTAKQSSNWEITNGTLNNVGDDIVITRKSSDGGYLALATLDMPCNLQNKNIAITMSASADVSEVQFYWYCTSRTALKFREGVSETNLDDARNRDTTYLLNPLFLEKHDGTFNDLADFRRLGIAVYLKDGSTSCSVTIKDIKVVDTIPKPGVVAIVFDDGEATQYTNAYAKMKTLDIKGSIGVITNSVGTAGFCTLPQLTEMYNSGWDMVSHTANHIALGAVEQSVVKSEMIESQQWLADNGFTRSHRHLIYPGGSYSDIAIKEAKKFFLSARALNNIKAGYPMVERYHYGHVLYVKNTTTLDEFKAKIDRVKEFGGVAMITFHTVGGVSAYDYNCSIELFGQMMDYLANSGVPTTTISKLFEGRTDIML